MKHALIVYADKNGPTIEPDIYGHFSEHLGRCIYGGLWVGEDSPIPNINGYRADVVEALKKIRIPNLRWPGGCFADEYHWKDGIGPKEERKRMVNTHWGGVVEDNSFGTHEFMDLCELLGCKAYVNGNVGSGTVQEMQEWVEYLTFDGDSPMSRLRAKNGRDKPWKLPYFGVGNENWGCGGNMTAAHYADVYRNFQTYVRSFGSNKIYKIACGASVADYEWTETLMKNAGTFMDGLSMHHYSLEAGWNDKGLATVFDEKGWFNLLKNAWRMEELVANHERIMDVWDPERRIGMIVDEWGSWHQVEPGTNPGFLYQQNTLRDALVAGITLNIFNNHADRVRMANLAQVANVLQSPILTEGDRMVLTPTWHIFDMYKEHQGAALLPVGLATSEYYGTEGGKGIPTLTASASRSASGTITVTITNADPVNSAPVPVSVSGAPVSRVSGRVLTAVQMNAYNDFSSPNTVVPAEMKLPPIRDGVLEVLIPAKSVAALTFS